MSKVIDRLEERKTAIDLEINKVEGEICGLRDHIDDLEERKSFLDELITEAKAIEASEGCDCEKCAEETAKKVLDPIVDPVLHFRD